MTPALDMLFAFGIDPADGQLPSDQLRLAAAGIFPLSKQARAQLDVALITTFRCRRAPASTAAAGRHRTRQMHAETLSIYCTAAVRHKRGRRAQPPARPPARRRCAYRPAKRRSAREAGPGSSVGQRTSKRTVDVPAFVIDKYR
jgi:hypothetical protein